MEKEQDITPRYRGPQIHLGTTACCSELTAVYQTLSLLYRPILAATIDKDYLVPARPIALQSLQLRLNELGLITYRQD